MDPEMLEILKSVIGEELEDEADLEAFIEKQKLGEKEANALKAAMRILNGFKEDGTIAKIMESMAKACSPSGNPFAAKKPEPEKADKADEGDETDTDTAKKEPDVAEDKIPESVQKKLDDADARAEKIEKANAELREEVKVEKRAREKSELISKCKELYSHVPGLSSEEQAEMLLDLDEKARKLLEKQWAATEEAIAKSELLTAGGTGGGFDPAGGDAGRKLEEIAKGMVEKSGGDLTPEAAYVRAMDANPDLYRQYLADNPKQTG
jgi:hypothetical protein